MMADAGGPAGRLLAPGDQSPSPAWHGVIPCSAGRGSAAAGRM